MKFKSLQKSKMDLGLRKTNMHVMKCNPIKLLFWGEGINLESFKIL
jgi:hypothetical protein